MAMEAIQEVAGMEERARQLKESAAAEAKLKIQAAQREAQQMLERSRIDANAQVRQMMADAEAQAAKVTQQVMEQAGQDCEIMKQEARTRLDQAAQLIVEKVVKR